MKIPPWLGNANDYSPCASGGTPAGEPFLERGLLEIATVVQQGGREGLAGKQAGLALLDPAAKLVACFIALAVVATTGSLTLLALVVGIAVVLARLSGIEARSFLGQILVILSLFGVCTALPALFAPFSPGPPLVSLGPLVVTVPGFLAATRLLFRMTASVSLAALLVRTTTVNELLSGLRSCGIPVEFTAIAGMTWRYIHVLATEVYQMHEGLLSRRSAPLGGGAGRAYVTSRMAVLLGKALGTAEEIHLAMLARGFTGEWRVLPRARKPGRRLIAGALLLVCAGVLARKAGLP
jgi:cobalt/nickel transport system permease protein